ncbi:MAG: hypothetical protein KKE42_02965 [Alphaproteobacteria bacterium]|uniref:hypothetical protein n=1 Tax=Brevundimonas sp. TaxID=1871086 RepID=UPI0017B46997|nr:hypothetical protein [Brevundimonas sp.]MBU3971448.1 hypothetical protein [Alphaproteobacteria bacterium]MBA3050730.1 hypothetical protein [Brevundimonas sp.]MBU3972745.1 hypothetical protein [Alphaproteobacteria bacterium]MBU4039477.1 hypothetical protein [Alphaproteobacteria bacterium]MBU4138071.1 hypothetical protein [Alphaproteobacteria bacterium]
MSARRLFILAAVAASLGACETLPMDGGGSGPGMGPRPVSTAFRADDFAWSSRAGRGSIDGRVAYRREGQAYDCTGSVALTPDTPYTRARFQTLYGSTDRAAIPEAVVRARTVPDPNADYRSFVRSTTCQNGRFEFTGLPDGDWFIIAPVSAGGDRIVLMRRVGTRGGRVSVTL